MSQKHIDAAANKKAPFHRHHSKHIKWALPLSVGLTMGIVPLAYGITVLANPRPANELALVDNLRSFDEKISSDFAHSFTIVPKTEADRVSIEATKSKWDTYFSTNTLSDFEIDTAKLTEMQTDIADIKTKANIMFDTDKFESSLVSDHTSGFINDNSLNFNISPNYNGHDLQAFNINGDSSSDDSLVFGNGYDESLYESVFNGSLKDIFNSDEVKAEWLKVFDTESHFIRDFQGTYAPVVNGNNGFWSFDQFYDLMKDTPRAQNAKQGGLYTTIFGQGDGAQNQASYNDVMNLGTPGGPFNGHDAGNSDNYFYYSDGAESLNSDGNGRLVYPHFVLQPNGRVSVYDSIEETQRVWFMVMKIAGLVIENKDTPAEDYLVKTVDGHLLTITKDGVIGGEYIKAPTTSYVPIPYASTDTLASLNALHPEGIFTMDNHGQYVLVTESEFNRLHTRWDSNKILYKVTTTTTLNPTFVNGHWSDEATMRVNHTASTYYANWDSVYAELYNESKEVLLFDNASPLDIYLSYVDLVYREYNGPFTDTTNGRVSEQEYTSRQNFANFYHDFYHDLKEVIENISVFKDYLFSNHGALKNNEAFFEKFVDSIIPNLLEVGKQDPADIIGKIKGTSGIVGIDSIYNNAIDISDAAKFDAFKDLVNKSFSIDNGGNPFANWTQFEDATLFKEIKIGQIPFLMGQSNGSSFEISYEIADDSEGVEIIPIQLDQRTPEHWLQEEEILHTSTGAKTLSDHEVDLLIQNYLLNGGL